MGKASAERPRQKTKASPPSKAPGVTSGGSKHGSTKRVVDVAVQKIGEKLSSEDVKATVGDFIRLLQLQKELDEEGAKEIRITWVEPVEMESVSEK